VVASVLESPSCCNHAALIKSASSAVDVQCHVVRAFDHGHHARHSIDPVCAILTFDIITAEICEKEPKIDFRHYSCILPGHGQMLNASNSLRGSGLYRYQNIII
jgi:hypothetical protein